MKECVLTFLDGSNELGGHIEWELYDRTGASGDTCITYLVQANGSVVGGTIDWIDCDGNPQDDTIAASTFTNVCAQPGTVVVNDPINITVTEAISGICGGDLQVLNTATDGVIDDISIDIAELYLDCPDVSPGGTCAGSFEPFTGGIITVNLTLSTTRTIRLSKNGITIDCIDAPTTGSYAFGAQNFGIMDLMVIELSDTPC